MPRNDQIARTLGVMSALAASRRGVALKSLAERHGWQLRTLYRDVQALERAGFPIIHEDGRWRIAFDGVTKPLASVDADELCALYVAREMARGLRGTSLGRALDRLWAK